MRQMSNSSPYRNVAVASTFSPRFKQVLAEAKRIRDRFDARLHVIFVGERTRDAAEKFANALAEFDLPADVPIHYGKGTPAKAILGAAEENNVDLIVAGALEREVVLRPFLGDVARSLVRDAKSSVFLFTKPEHTPRAMKRIVFVTDYSDHSRNALRHTFHLAAAESCERLYVVRVYTTFDRARANLQTGPEQGDSRARTFEEEEAALEEFILSAGHTDVLIEARCLRGNTGFAASDFVQSIEADLLAVPAPPGANGLSSRVAWVTDVIPCNLWVIR
jgi:nucleotide-binding universal stress UspA family protein